MSPELWIVKVKPSALALVSWKEKLLVKDWMLTGVVKNALPVSLPAVLESVRRRREAAEFQIALPLSCKPEVEVKPDPKLMEGEPVLMV